MALFEKDLKIFGKHSFYITELKEKNIFPTYREIYVIATSIGFLYGLKSPIDRSENIKSSTIFASDLTAQKSNLRFLYRLIMLLDKKEDYEIDDYKNRAFRDDAEENNEDKMKENMDIFDSYFRGGLEKLYDMFKDADEKKNQANILYEFVYNTAQTYGYLPEDENNEF